MKKIVSIWLLPLAIAAAGCTKAEISSTSGAGSNTSSTPSPETDTSTGVDPEDSYNEDAFDRTITISWSGESATVSGDEKGIVSVNGAHVTVNNSAEEKVKYLLSGTSANASLKLYSSKKQVLQMEGLNLTNPSGAVINNQGKKSCYVIVNGSNSLKDGSSAAYTATGDEDLKAVFFSEGQLLFSGTGSLSVTALNAQGKSAVTSDDYVSVDGPSLTISSGSGAGHGLRGKESVIVNAGTLDISVSADMKKGITSDSLIVFNGGTTVVKASGGTAQDPEEDNEYKASAGIKADQVFKMNDGSLSVSNSGQGGKGITGDAVAYFNGGTVSVNVTGANYGSSGGQGGPGGGGTPPGGGPGRRSTDSTDSSKAAKAIKFDGDIHFTGGSVSASAQNHEAIEAKGVLTVTGGTVYAKSSDDAINSGGNMTISGGYVCAYSTGNDGLDANGNCYIKGGVVYAVGSKDPEVGIDANTEQRCYLYVSGGTLFVIGGLEKSSNLSQSCYSTNSWSRNTWYALTVGDTTHAFLTPDSGGTALVVSGASKPELLSGVSVADGTSVWEGMGVMNAMVSGGSAVNLSTYSSNGR